MVSSPPQSHLLPLRLPVPLTLLNIRVGSEMKCEGEFGERSRASLSLSFRGLVSCLQVHSPLHTHTPNATWKCLSRVTVWKHAKRWCCCWSQWSLHDHGKHEDSGVCVCVMCVRASEASHDASRSPLRRERSWSCYRETTRKRKKEGESDQRDQRSVISRRGKEIGEG